MVQGEDVALGPNQAVGCFGYCRLLQIVLTLGSPSMCCCVGLACCKDWRRRECNFQCTTALSSVADGRLTGQFTQLIFFGMLLGAPEIWCFASLVIMKNIMCVSLFTLKQLKWPGICPIHDWSTMGQEPRRTKALSSMAMEATMTLDEAWCRSAMATLGGGNVFFGNPRFFYGFSMVF